MTTVLTILSMFFMISSSVTIILCVYIRQKNSHMRRVERNARLASARRREHQRRAYTSRSPDQATSVVFSIPPTAVQGPPALPLLPPSYESTMGITPVEPDNVTSAPALFEGTQAANSVSPRSDFPSRTSTSRSVSPMTSRSSSRSRIRIIGTLSLGSRSSMMGTNSRRSRTISGEE